MGKTTGWEGYCTTRRRKKRRRRSEQEEEEEQEQEQAGRQGSGRVLVLGTQGNPDRNPGALQLPGQRYPSRLPMSYDLEPGVQVNAFLIQTLGYLEVKQAGRGCSF